MFLVLGLTGKVGGAVAERLLETGHAVRALVRDQGKAAGWAEKGVDLRQGDFTDVEALTAALEDVEGAFLMLPPFFTPQPGFPEAQAIVASFREAMRRSLPERVVALSSVGSQRGSGLGMITATHLLEAGLDDMPLPLCFVRPGSFLEPEIRERDELSLDAHWEHRRKLAIFCRIVAEWGYIGPLGISRHVFPGRMSF